MNAKLPHPSRVDAEAGSDPAALWIFGYGSLVWRPEFPHLESRVAWVEGWTRRFWQGSTDHRGVPGAPGRVVTLVPEPRMPEPRMPEIRCWGTAYRVEPDHATQVLGDLDHREKGGYDRVGVPLHFRVRGGDGSSERGETPALMYVATPDNPNYLGPAPLEAIARQVIASRGPSGANREYVHRLADALLEICPGLGEQDEDVLVLARLLENSPVVAPEPGGAGT
jgi:cation transport protein ChaC